MTVVPEVFPCEQDRAQFQHFAELPGIELYQAHISRYAFEPHTHEAFGIGTIESGAQRFRYRGTNYVAPVHSLVMTVCICLAAPRMASTGQAWRHLVQPMHSASRM